MPGIMEVYSNGAGLTIHGTETITTTSVNNNCFEKGIVLSQLSLKRKSLETRFLEITGTQATVNSNYSIKLLLIMLRNLQIEWMKIKNYPGCSRCFLFST